MTILELFKQFSGKFCLFLASNFECFTKYDPICSHIFNHACLRRVRHIVMKRLKIAEKFYSSKALLKWVVGGYIHPWILSWQWRAVGETKFDLPNPGIKPQTSRTHSDVFNTELTGRFGDAQTFHLGRLCITNTS